jgi:hypothetical protein
MATKRKTTKKKTTSKKSSGGFGLVALAAATAATAAGAYFLYGSKNASKNRKKIKGWTLKAKGEVLEKMEKMKNIDETDYKRIVDTVAAKYKKIKTVNTKEAEALAKELKAQWKEIHKSASPKKKAKKAVKKKK